MKKYNIQNYIRYKEDLKSSMPPDKFYDYYTRDEMIIKFMPLVENIARKFSTSQQASGVMSINDLIQEGAIGLTQAVDKLDWVEKLADSDDIEKTLKSFFSKRIKGAIRRAIDNNRGNIRIPEHKLNQIRKDNGKDKKMVELFFNSIFSSIDEEIKVDGTPGTTTYADVIEDKTEDYNKELLSAYILSLMEKYLHPREYAVLKYSYGINADKMKAKLIAEMIGLKGNSAHVRVSEIKKEAIQKLIENVDHSQVIDYL
jgi:RNA polymerase sigma factor (sigma-70 family)